MYPYLLVSSSFGGEVFTSKKVLTASASGYQRPASHHGSATAYVQPPPRRNPTNRFGMIANPFTLHEIQLSPFNRHIDRQQENGVAMNRISHDSAKFHSSKERKFHSAEGRVPKNKNSIERVQKDSLEQGRDWQGLPRPHYSSGSVAAPRAPELRSPPADRARAAAQS